MKYKIIPVTAYQQNCTLLWCEKTAYAALVDPGGEANKLIHAIKKKNVVLKNILLTHGHADHVVAAAKVAEYFKVPILGPAIEDKFLLDNLPMQSMLLGDIEVAPPFTPNSWLQGGDHITVGTLDLEVLFCPGHSPGHVIFVEKKHKIALVGDVIFNYGIGRTDLPQGNKKQLLSSIKQKVLPLGEDMTFIPGHGAVSTVGYEIRNNPFLK